MTFEKSNAEIEKFAKDNNMCIESTCNDMQEHIRVWELVFNIERTWVERLVNCKVKLKCSMGE